MDGFSVKKILIFRSAKHPVVKECIEKINHEYKECNIWMCIQEQCLNQYSEYANIRFIIFPNGMFSYEKTASNMEICDSLRKTEFDEIVITYSSPDPHCEEIEKIILNILRKKSAVYCDSDIKMHKKRIHIRRIKPKKIIKKIRRSLDFTLTKVIYLYFVRRKK